MRWIAVALALSLASCGGGSGSQAPVRVVAAGDSITLRDGFCAYPCAVQTSYAAYLPDVAAIEGRGGDTCTLQAPWGSGPNKGKSRGLHARLYEIAAHKPTKVLVLIGANDVAGWDVATDNAVACVRATWAWLRAAGITPIALTYPPIADDTQVWGLPHGEARRRVEALNEGVRLAAAADAVQLIDLHPLRGYTTSDGAHPDVAGAQLMAARARA